MPKQLRAVVSARVSSFTEVSTSASSQHDNGETKASQLGAVVVGRPADLDVSALKVSPWGRPELGAWLRRPDDFDVLIVRSIDRLCRRVVDLVKMIDWCEAHKIRLVFLQQDLDLGTPFGRAVAHILGAVAELEANMTATRVRDARKYMKSVARWPAGQPVFGYRLTTHPSGRGYALEIDPETGPIMRDIIEQVLAGRKPDFLAQRLNETNTLSPLEFTRRRRNSLRRVRDARGGEQNLSTSEILDRMREGATFDFVDGHSPISPTFWSAAHIRSLLGAPREGRYNEGLRALVWETDEATGKRSPVLDEDGVQLRYTLGDPLVSDEEWSRLQEILRASARSSHRERTDGDPLLHVVYCHDCGQTMYRQTKHRSGKTEYRYVCISNARKSTGCPGAAVNLDELWDVLERAWLREVGQRPLMVKHEVPASDYSAEIEEIEDRLNDLEEDRYTRGLFTGDRGAARFAELHQKNTKRLDHLRSLPTTESHVWWETLNITLADEWAGYEGDEAMRALRGRAKFYVRGKIKDGPASERVTWDVKEWSVGLAHASTKSAEPILSSSVRR